MFNAQKILYRWLSYKKENITVLQKVAWAMRNNRLLDFYV